MDLKELENGIDPEVHWYYQSKKLPLLRYTKQALASGKPLTIVDIGSGSGFFALELEKKFGSAIAKVYLVDTGYSVAEMAHRERLGHSDGCARTPRKRPCHAAKRESGLRGRQ
jgi:ubiquinone/menaquinone biosynthesis C-methylase UbiE